MIFDSTNYRFNLPKSKFPEVKEGERNMISYVQKMVQVQQDTFKPKLSEQQLKSIEQSGTFQVKSNKQNSKIPYIWKINDWLMRGRVNIILVWECGIGAIYSRITSLLDMVTTTIPRSIRKLSKIPVRLFALIFGKKTLHCVYDPDNHQEVIKDFWCETMENQFKDVKKSIGSQFLQLFYLEYEEALYRVVDRKGKSVKQIQKQQQEREKKINKYSQKKSKITELKTYLRQLDTRFQLMWTKIRKRVLIKISNQVTGSNSQKKLTEEQGMREDEKLIQKQSGDTNQKIVNKFHQQKFTMYKNYLKQSIQKQKKLDTLLVQQLIILITIITIIENNRNNKNRKLQIKKQYIGEHIHNKYKIRSRDHCFFQKQVQNLYLDQKNVIEMEFYNGLMSDEKLDKLVNQQFKNVYQKYLAFRTNYQSLLTKKQQQTDSLYIPNRVFHSTYRLLPPYEIKNSNGYYYLKKNKQVEMDTSFNYWKISLYKMRIKTWTINCAIFLLYCSWNGMFGFRCLFGKRKFVIDEDVNGRTGEKINVERAPVLKVFNTVIQGVVKSRNYFQSLPDRGLFGKKFSRVFNYIECYVFRFVFVGIIIVLILYPISIIISSLICIVLILSVWIWVPIILMVTYLFNILIFQFESFASERSLKIGGIPLLMIILQIIIEIIKCILCVLWLGVGILFSFGHFLALILQRYWRKVTDKIMIFVIGYMGRTPSRDTAIAKKISGPGITRSYFYSVLEEDVYILTQCALEKIVMNKFVQLMKNQINYNADKYQKIIQFTTKPFNSNIRFMPTSRNIVINNSQNLLQTFNTCIYNYMCRYPNYPSRVRFTYEQLSRYYINTIKIVKNYVQKQEIKQWIFQQRGIAYEDYSQLTRNIWIQIFNCGEEIFQPIQSIDCRVKLVESGRNEEEVIMRKNVKAIVSALEGEIQLTTSQFQFCPGEKSLLERDEPIRSLSLLCDVHQAHSELNIGLDLDNPIDLVVIPRNLKELKRYEEWRYEQVMEANGSKCQKVRGREGSK